MRGYNVVGRNLAEDWKKLARDKLKDKKIAVVHDNTTYGKGLADAALDNMHKFDVEEVLYEGVNTGEKDFSAIVSKIKASGADYLMWVGLHMRAASSSARCATRA
jgi:branched-chain amino acid transport system substrate-binding protein